MKKNLIIFCLFSGISLYGQTAKENIIGKISFISSQNIYVKFRSTAGITAGDTLFISAGEKLTPALKVLSMSSTSCVCNSLSEISLPVDHLIVARIVPETPVLVEKEVKETEKVNPLPSVKTDSATTVNVPAERQQQIRGSISANSYSDFTNTDSKNLQRFRYTFSLDARNIGNSRISYENYLSFRHKSGEWSAVKQDLFSALKIYSLAVIYDMNKTTRFMLGRKINPKIASMGAIDGLQFEKTFKGITAGALAGTRPDYLNYGFNKDLLQFGGYIALNTRSARTYTETSFAFMQQMNKSKTDRRFLYFQHSSSLLNNLYFMSSFEVDLYKLESGAAKNTFDLTGAWLSLRYNLTKSFSLSGSYDARKNIMFYETFKSLTDSLLQNELRQGFRLGANLKITKNISAGLQAGYRYLKTDPIPSKNFYGYLSYFRMPGTGITATLSGSYMESGFMTIKMGGLNLSREFLKGKVQTALGYHFMDYTLPENKIDLIQHAGEANLSLQIFETVSLSVNYERIFEKQNSYNRVYFQVRKRF